MSAKEPKDMNAKVACRHVNIEVADLTRNRHFNAIPIDDLFGICNKYCFELAPEEDGFILCGREGRVTFHFYRDQKPFYLHLSWYKMSVTGNYEIVSYID